jgi:hypothetical protein
VKVSSNTLKVPSVGALYPSHGDDPDINLWQKYDYISGYIKAYFQHLVAGKNIYSKTSIHVLHVKQVLTIKKKHAKKSVWYGCVIVLLTFCFVISLL